ncbi:hypothetical protein ACJX0J_039566 [Zea mays]
MRVTVETPLLLQLTTSTNLHISLRNEGNGNQSNYMEFQVSQLFSVEAAAMVTAAVLFSWLMQSGNLMPVAQHGADLDFKKKEKAGSDGSMYRSNSMHYLIRASSRLFA